VAALSAAFRRGTVVGAIACASLCSCWRTSCSARPC